VKGDAEVTPKGPLPVDLIAARAAAANVVVHGFPAMLMDLVRRAHPVGFHQFQLIAHDAGNLAPGLAEDDARVVVCSAFIDVGDGPVVLRLPHTHGRFFNLTLMDSVGEPFESLDFRLGDDAGVDLALVGPEWRGELPRGLRAKRAPGDSVWAVYRIHAHSQLDRPDAVRVAERLVIAVLRPEGMPRGSMTSVMEPPSSPCLRQIAELAPATFFHRLEAVLKHAPAAYHSVERPIIEGLLAQLGRSRDPADWPQDFADAVSRGFADGMEAIRAAAAAAESERPGWRIRSGRLNEPSAPPLTAAARAFANLGAAVREDVLTLACEHDDTGSSLTGAHAYRIRFPRDALPPVNAFWRLAAHPAGRPAAGELGSYSNLTPNPDGSCDILVQHWPPPIDMVGNWLPTPDGRFSLVMRLYGPRPGALGGAWRMSPVQRLDAGPASSTRSPPRPGVAAAGDSPHSPGPRATPPSM
jgi:hypothetical protein